MSNFPLEDAECSTARLLCFPENFHYTTTAVLTEPFSNAPLQSSRLLVQTTWIY